MQQAPSVNNCPRTCLGQAHSGFRAAAHGHRARWLRFVWDVGSESIAARLIRARKYFGFCSQKSYLNEENDMNNKTMLQRSLLTTGITLALGLSFGLSQNALADTASDDLEVKAGLSQAMSLDCVTDGIPLNFGITRINVDAYNTATEITVPATSGGSASVDAGGTGVSAGSVQRGACALSGSSATNGATLTVTFADSGDSSFADNVLTLSGDGSAYSLDAPTTALSDLTVSSLTSSASSLTDGASTIGIGGTLNIPATLVADNLGGYSASVQVTVDDGFGD